MPKLALRDLFAVVTIVALALGWGLERWRASRLEKENRLLLHELMRETDRRRTAEGHAVYIE